MNKLQLLCIAKGKKWVMYRRDGTSAMNRIQNLVVKSTTSELIAIFNSLSLSILKCDSSLNISSVCANCCPQTQIQDPSPPECG